MGRAPVMFFLLWFQEIFLFGLNVFTMESIFKVSSDSFFFLFLSFFFGRNYFPWVCLFL